jgi:hypothetical protein
VTRRRDGRGRIVVLTPDNFADAPLSVGEIRATKERDGSKWSPRDVLIETLRLIDSGELDLDVCVVCWRTKDDGGISWTQASPDFDLSISVMAQAMHSLIDRSKA